MFLSITASMRLLNWKYYKKKKRKVKETERKEKEKKERELKMTESMLICLK